MATASRTMASKEHDFLNELAKSCPGSLKTRFMFLVLGIAGFFFPGIAFAALARAVAKVVRDLKIKPHELDSLLDFLAYGENRE